jgi:Flp pilus assembly protein TadD
MLALCCVLAAGCSVRQPVSGGAGLRKTVDTWETNRTIIRAAENSGNFDIALATATGEIAQRPDNREARITLARLQTKTGQPEQAVITLEAMAGDDSPEALLEMGRARLALDRVDEAVDLLDRALSRSAGRPLTREANKLRAVAADLRGRHDEAQNLYRTLLGEQDEIGVRYNYGRSLISSGKYSQAVGMLLPLVERYELPQARVAAAAAMAKNKDEAGARNLLHGYMPEDDITRVLKGKKR